ncbi:MAG: alpha/beta hydrolase [Firmicutes bacterium]|nr:alpha/beta hydrolase [Bacillota bacterium]
MKLFRYFLIFMVVAGLILTSCASNNAALPKIIPTSTAGVSGKNSTSLQGAGITDSPRSPAGGSATSSTPKGVSVTKSGLPAITGTTLIYGLPTTTTEPPYRAFSTTLAGTYPWGPVQSLGPVNRIQFPPLLAKQTGLAPNPPLGLPASKLITVGYRSFGQGQPIVLLGGQDSTMTTWPPSLLLSLEQNFHVIIFDLPGTGYSPLPNQKLNLTNVSDDVAGFISALNLQNPLLLGWGLGGSISLRVAETHPGLLGGLVLIDSGSGGKGGIYRQYLAGHMNSWFTYGQTSAKATYLSSLLDYAPDALQTSGLNVWSSLAEQASSDNFTYDRLHLIDVATLIEVGDSDSVFPPHDSEILHRYIPTSRLVRYAHSGYATVIVDAAQVVSSLQQFASSVTTTTG